MKTEPVAVSIVLSDYVITEQGTGKHSLIGTFHNYNFPRFPAAPPPYFITVSLTNLDTTIREYDVLVRIEDPSNGMVLTNVGAHIQLPEGAKMTKETVIDIPLPGSPFVVQKPGSYVVRVLLNNEDAGHRPLQVFSVTAPANPSP
jgi:hypothetical protein